MSPHLVGHRPLVGRCVRLEPLEERHVELLAQALTPVRDVYAFTAVPKPGDVADYVAQCHARAGEGAAAAYVQVDISTNRVVGHTAFCSPVWIDGRLSSIEVGYTWLVPESQGTAINSEAKLLLFDHAFDAWHVDRVELRTDARNSRSRAAIEAVGGVFEGVLRNCERSRVKGEEGCLRNTALYSLVPPDWPETRSRLVARVVARQDRPHASR